MAGRFAVQAVLFSFALSGCTTVDLRTQAQALRLEDRLVAGAPFTHQVYATPDAARSGNLIILIEGDGRAFLNRTTVARDPTPLHSPLLAMAPTLASFGNLLYLGRPCYHAAHHTTGCRPQLWTSHRYSQQVIASLVAAATPFLPTDGELWLIGHSGGGVLALQVARALASGSTLTKDRLRVLTIGAPLDLAAWVEQHQYTPLTGSEDPANDPAIFGPLCQRHLYGDQDRTVPVELINRWRWPRERVQIIAGADHSTRWGPALTTAMRTLQRTCLRDGQQL